MFLDNFYRKIGFYIIKWLIINLLLGFLGAVLVLALKKGIFYLNQFFYNKYYIAPLIGSVIIAIIIYYLDFRARGLGTDIYIRYTNNKYPLKSPFRLLISKFLATSTTLGLMGIGGLVGPLLLIGSSMAIVIDKVFNYFKVKLFNSQLDYRVLSVCGAAATLGPLLGAPLGGGIFASEILYKSSLDYNDLFPAILGSSFGYYFYHAFLPMNSLNIDLALPEATLKEIFLLILVAIISGIIGQSFISIFEAIDDYFSRLRIKSFLKPIITGVIVLMIMKLLKVDSFIDIGDINQLVFSPLREGRMIILIIVKILLAMVIIGGGCSAAIVDTALISGALTGNLLYYIFPNIPLSILVIIGLSATLASIANIPLATMIIVSEIFNLNLSLPVIIGSIIGYLIGRPKAVFKYIGEE
ncbi:CIC family chloride channel protein [Orenia metallireducens]|jgi:CIC family chloride channel protein|uniref:Chloride channel protein, CIC family n=1 Tax=Orenia metallireducens TaxID=1413210 RepID=A0A285FIA2_9FIRM|nr:chloride channel protein [Orenia metallireducens]PRX33569.1 CIC family chloride channel protein [Orenia metallireducens]SNY11022.1 chloride channel protein, CIC family [Orenia metallireducens]